MITRSPLADQGRPARRCGCRRGLAGRPGRGPKGRSPWSRRRGPRRCGICLSFGTGCLFPFAHLGKEENIEWDGSHHGQGNACPDDRRST